MGQCEEEFHYFCCMSGIKSVFKLQNENVKNATGVMRGRGMGELATKSQL